MTITTSNGYSSNCIDKIWASSKASISQRTSLPFNDRMITLDCCHPGRNAWDMILFFLPHSTSASIATCVFTEYLIFYFTIQHYVASDQKKKKKNLILQHKTTWFFHEQYHLAVIVQQKWRTAYETTVTGWLGRQSQALQINHGSEKDHHTPCSACLTQQVSSACGSEKENGVQSLCPRVPVMHSLQILFPSPKMLTFAELIFWFCSTRSQEFLGALCSLGR